MANPNPHRHNPPRLFRAQELATDLWGAPSVLLRNPSADPRDLPSVSEEPFFIGGGALWDVYAYTVTYAVSVSVGAEGEPVRKEVCLRVPREAMDEVEKVILVKEEMFWHRKLGRLGRERGGYGDGGVKGVQKMLEYEYDIDNVLESPYIGLEWVGGRKLEWSDSVPGERERRKVIEQVAEICMGLLRINEGWEGFGTAGDWMKDRIVSQMGHIASGEGRESPVPTIAGDAMDALDARSRLQIREVTGGNEEAMAATQRAMLDKHVILELDHAPYVCVHGDVDTTNLIVDDEYNVTLIDMELMHLGPLEFAATYPRFLTHEPEPMPIPPDIDNRTEIQGWAKGWGGKDTPQMRKDREMYLDVVQKAAKREVEEVKTQEERDKRLRFDKQVIKSENEWPMHRLLEKYSEVLGREGEVNRYWWIAAMGRADVWAQMEACGWVPKKEVEESGGSPGSAVVID